VVGVWQRAGVLCACWVVPVGCGAVDSSWSGCVELAGPHGTTVRAGTPRYCGVVCVGQGLGHLRPLWSPPPPPPPPRFTCRLVGRFFIDPYAATSLSQLMAQLRLHRDSLRNPFLRPPRSPEESYVQQPDDVQVCFVDGGGCCVGLPSLPTPLPPPSLPSGTCESRTQVLSEIPCAVLAHCHCLWPRGGMDFGRSLRQQAANCQRLPTLPLPPHPHARTLATRAQSCCPVRISYFHISLSRGLATRVTRVPCAFLWCVFGRGGVLQA
jgi:hypothetical protein